MKKTKFLCLFMALSLLLCFTACGNKKEDDVRGQIHENTEESTEKDTLSLGKSQGTTYESAFIGLGWTLPEGWSFLSDKEMKALNNITTEQIDNEEIQEALKNAKVIYDMYAMNATTGDSVNITLEKLDPAVSLLYDESAYINASLTNLGAAMESSGYKDVQIAKSTIHFCGKDYEGIKLQASSGNIIIYEKLTCIKVGNYMAVIVAASTKEATTETIFENFYTLDK